MIVDPTVGGTHMTILNTVVNIVKQIIESLTLYGLYYVSFEYYFYFAIIYMSFMLYNTKHIAGILDSCTAAEFTINIINKEFNYDKTPTKELDFAEEDSKNSMTCTTESAELDIE